MLAYAHSPARLPLRRRNAGSLALDFTGGTLPAGVTLTRGSAGGYVTNAGVLASAANDVARFDYDPVSLASRGILVEPARTNLLTYAEQFDNAAWIKSSVTITADAIAAPSGSTVADLLTQAASSRTYQAKTLVAGTTYALSFYVKKSAADWILIKAGDATTTTTGNGVRAWLNVTTGAVGSSGVIGSGWAYVGHSITSMGNGWYRCVLIFTAGGTTSYSIVNGVTADGATTPTNMHIYAWGAQLEAGDSVSSYIPTTTASASRSADALAFIVPAGITNLRYTFDDNSTQDVAVTAGAYTVPTTLNRRRIKSILGS